MAKYANGNRSQAISDRSGMAFPYGEMVTEWNGSFVHISEFEAKQPQIRRKRMTADAIALQKVRPQRFQQPIQPFTSDVTIASSGGTMIGIANLTLPGQFAFINQGTSEMKPADPSLQNRRRQAITEVGNVTIGIS
tara:strand:+ start:2185 stop:2592 length:408 start_codon:yes stop_codon:yes gene_type:complete